MKKRLIIILATLLTIIVLFITYGTIHARKLKTQKYTVSINKEIKSRKELRIALVSDLHLGNNIGIKEMKKMVKVINENDVDAVLIAGDVFSNKFEALSNPEGVIEVLKSIKSKDGVYAVFGNHDIDERLFMGFTLNHNARKEASDEMYDFIKKAGIILLEDQSILVKDDYYIVGRADYSKPGKHVKVRKSPKEILQGLDKNKPIIVLDHQPREQKELSRYGADLDLNGHTHNGQIWPMTWGVKIAWDNPYGYKKYGNTHNIVTSGVGLYGPYMRVNSNAEVAIINVKLK